MKSIQSEIEKIIEKIMELFEKQHCSSCPDFDKNKWLNDSELRQALTALVEKAVENAYHCKKHKKPMIVYEAICWDCNQETMATLTSSRRKGKG